MTANLTKYAKKLRKNATAAEGLLWSKLRARQMEGIKFRRQQPIENYVVDFVSFEKRIVIELDGGQHATDREKDRNRDRLLSENGFIVLRFWNNEVFENLEGVLEVIRRQCLE
jgi:very-short-patch-repair endonuclease